ncbi:putative mediator of RNA polymerase II transcription subunit 26b-like [Dorcoceras hygrometricum]|uniref:Putative mediator of RNA polymerase II transcription subunit 26b-like n=1 Tax=Dorcoceras hygrometricum TaxID=472368 RepID=A0A2Z7CRV6_9LAMI|nr:putative mediator of RNA polymerase II transcription subunit 26b-like [Dorcoceras hygrometricum]
MGDVSVTLGKWREFFRSSNSNIFNVIEHAIMVAACDYPYDFKLKRDRIAEMLFVSKMTKCFGCDRTELFVANCDGVENIGGNAKSRTGESKDTEESKVDNNSGGDDYDESRREIKANWNCVSHCSFGDAEALTDELDEEFKVIEEVLRIKEILDNREEESVEVLFDSLRRLQLMCVSLETLKVTDIGKSVKVLQKHASKEIQNLVTELMEDWRIMIDAWVESTAAITGSGEAETESVKMTSEEDGGLPSPPLDEGALFTTTASMELSRFFDGMDDDEILGNSGTSTKNQNNSRKLTLKNPISSSIPPNNRKVEQKKCQEVILKKQTLKPNRPQNGECRPVKPKSQYTETRLAKQNPPSNQSGSMRPKPAKPLIMKSAIEIQQRPDTGTIQKKPMPPKQKLDFNNEASVQVKLAVAKRKLQERYQAAENAKKQRTIRVVELHDLPKKRFAQRNNQHMKSGASNKSRPKLRH